MSKDQPSDAHAAVLAKETGIPLDVARFTVGAAYRPAPVGPALAAEERDIFERCRRAGLIARVPDLDGAFDPSFNDPGRP